MDILEKHWNRLEFGLWQIRSLEINYQTWLIILAPQINFLLTQLADALYKLQLMRKSIILKKVKN